MPHIVRTGCGLQLGNNNTKERLKNVWQLVIKKGKRTLSQASTRFQIPYSHSMIVRHGKKEFSTRVKRQRLNPTIMTDLSGTQFVKKWRSRKGKRLTNVHKHCPRSASQSLIVLSREAVMTKEIPNESTFCDCVFAGCKGENAKRDKFSKLFGVLRWQFWVLPEQPALWSLGLTPWGQIRHIQCDYRVRAFLF